MTDWGKVEVLAGVEVPVTARYLLRLGEGYTSRSARCAEAHAVACLLQAIEAAGVRVGVSYGALVEALEEGRRDDVRVIVSVTRRTIRATDPPEGQ